MVQFTSVTSLLSSTVALVFLLSASARPVPDHIDLIARTGTSELRNDALIRQNAPTTYFSVEVEETAKKITFSVKQVSSKPEGCDLEHLVELQTVTASFGDTLETHKDAIIQVVNKSPNLYYLGHWANNAKVAMTKAKDTGKVIANTAHRNAIVRLTAIAYSEHFRTQYFQVADALDTIGGFKTIRTLGEKYYGTVATNKAAAKAELSGWTISGP